MKANGLPQTDSIEELARFWDTHDLTDFEDQLDEVREPVFERETVIPLHLQPMEAERVRQIAQEKGVAGAELVRSWVLERIRAG